MCIHTFKAKNMSPAAMTLMSPMLERVSKKGQYLTHCQLYLGDFIGNILSKIKLKIWMKALKIIFLEDCYLINIS